MKTTKKIAYKTVKIWELVRLSSFLIINECQKWFCLIVGFFSTFPLTILSYSSKIVGV